MNTSPCYFYRVDRITRSALNFLDAERGELVRTYTANSGENIAIIIDSQGLFVETYIGLVKVTGKMSEERLDLFCDQVKRLATEYVKEDLSQFHKDINQIRRRV